MPTPPTGPPTRPTSLTEPTPLNEPTSTTRPTLLANSMFTPHPTLSDQLPLTVSKFVQELPELDCEEPIDGEQYDWPNQVQDGFKISLLRKDLQLLFLVGLRRKEE